MWRKKQAGSPYSRALKELNNSSLAGKKREERNEREREREKRKNGLESPSIPFSRSRVRGRISVSARDVCALALFIDLFIFPRSRRSRPFYRYPEGTIRLCSSSVGKTWTFIGLLPHSSTDRFPSQRAPPLQPVTIPLHKTERSKHDLPWSKKDH